MLPGFNHNIKYKNQIFHVQTEDSGEENPFIISHLFISGNIIATKKTNYSHILGSENLYNSIRSIMENQHKELIKDLITGKYDSHPLLSQQPDRIQSLPLSDNALPKKTIQEKNIQQEEVGYQSPQKQSPFKPVSSTSTFTVYGEGTINEESLDKIILRFLEENKQS